MPDVLDAQIHAMCDAGLTDDDVMRLAIFRQRVAAGVVHDDTVERRRAEFQRYLAIKAGRYLED